MSAKVAPSKMFFSRELYDRYNTSGVETACSFLQQQGYEIVKTLDDAYGLYDFIVKKDGTNYTIEAEVTAKWIGHSFPYRQMSVPHRKKKSIADFYIRTNPAGSALFFLPMKQVHAAPVIVKDTCYTKGEAFFNLPVSDLPLWICRNGTWKREDV